MKNIFHVIYAATDLKDQAMSVYSKIILKRYV